MQPTAGIFFIMLASLSRVWHFGHWFFVGLIAGLGRIIWVGTGRKKRRNPDEPPVTTDGGSFNAWRGH